MGSSKETAEPSLFIRVLAHTFYIIRVVLMPTIYVANIPLLVLLGPHMHPLVLLLILGTTNAMLTIFVVSMFSLAVAGVLLERSRPISTLAHMIRYCFYLMCKIYGKLYHGYTIHGLEHLMNCRAGLIVFYHIQLPLDLVYVITEMYFKTGRIIGGVAHREMLGKWNFLLKYMKFSSTRERLVRDIKAGNIRALAPGGERETVFSKNYQMEWNKRVGFAQIAKELGVPIFPLFAANGRESMPLTTYGFYDLCLEVYEKTRSYFYALLIILPVKMRIYIGEPLYCRDDESPEKFAERVKRAVEKLRDTHQRKPGSVLAALLERFKWQ